MSAMQLISSRVEEMDAGVYHRLAPVDVRAQKMWRRRFEQIDVARAGLAAEVASEESAFPNTSVGQEATKVMNELGIGSHDQAHDQAHGSHGDTNTQNLQKVKEGVKNMYGQAVANVKFREVLGPFLITLDAHLKLITAVQETLKGCVAKAHTCKDTVEQAQICKNTVDHKVLKDAGDALRLLAESEGHVEEHRATTLGHVSNALNHGKEPTKP